MDDDALLTRTEALRLLRVGKDWLYTDEGKTLPMVRVGRRLLIRRGALTAWVRAHEAPRAGRAG